jgi:hypothetical protein
MTFAEVLPHLAAGKIARRIGGHVPFEYQWDGRLQYRNVGEAGWGYSVAELKSLLASGWELAEEPAPMACSRCTSMQATIDRLTRELFEAKQAMAAARELFQAYK